MKIEQEFMLQKNIGRYPSGTPITGVTIHTVRGDVMLDLTKVPDWFKPLRGSWIPSKGDQVFYVDENLEVKSLIMPEDTAHVTPDSAEGKKLFRGNYYQKKSDAQIAASQIWGAHKSFHEDLAQRKPDESEKPG